MTQDRLKKSGFLFRAIVLSKKIPAPHNSLFLCTLFTASILLCLVSKASGSTAVGNLLHQKNGNVSWDLFGYSVAGAGDIDADGKADFVVGSPQVDPNGLTDAGSAFVYSGATGTLLYRMDGSTGDSLGFSVAGLGDVNSDGYADFMVGAPGADPNGIGSAGSAYVYSGATGTLLYQKNGAAVFDELGRSLAECGDINSDGIPDFIIGVPFADPNGIFAAGSAFIYSGATGSLLISKNGPAPEDRFGESVAGAGDIDGDGNADYIVGVPYAGWYQDSGAAFVYSGATGNLLYQKRGSPGGDLLGMSASGIGDINGDGKADFIIGAPRAYPQGLSGAGSAYVYSGADGTLIYQKNGTSTYNYFGQSVGGSGDVDGDGIKDFVIGAYGASPGGNGWAGSAFVYSGATGNLLFQKDGSYFSHLGWSVAGVGDVNADGRDDVIIGAILAGDGQNFRVGSSYVYAYTTVPPTDSIPPSISVISPNIREDWIVGTPQTILWSTYDNDGIASVEIRIDRNNDGTFEEQIADLTGNPPGTFQWTITGPPSDSAKIQILVRDFSNNIGTDSTDSVLNIVQPRRDVVLLYQKNGSTAGERFGRAISVIGDADGNGKIDFIVGAPNTSGGGSVFVHALSSGSLLYQKNAPFGGSYGRAVAGGKDVNLDGFPDFIVGAPGVSSVYIHSGADGALLQQKSRIDAFGSSVALMEDSDNDGKADYMVGAPFEYCSGTRFPYYGGGGYVFSATAGNALLETHGCFNDLVGSYVGEIGDINGDGKQDFVICASGGALTQVFSGATRSVIYAKGRCASAVGLGDISGDGKADFILGNPDENMAFIYSGGTGVLSYYKKSPFPSSSFGLTISGLGDVDSDGIFDFAIGLPGADPEGLLDAGVVLIYSGANGALLFQVNGVAAGDGFGTSIAGFADSTDGRSLIVVGAPSADPNGLTDAGSVYVYSLPCATPLKGDLNSDGMLNLTDVVIQLNAVFLGENIQSYLCAADVNCDFLLTASDVVILLNAVYLFYTINCLP